MPVLDRQFLRRLRMVGIVDLDRRDGVLGGFDLVARAAHDVGTGRGEGGNRVMLGFGGFPEGDFLGVYRGPDQRPRAVAGSLTDASAALVGQLGGVPPSANEPGAEDAERFDERKDKLAAQYDGYVVVDGLTINGQFTSGENIGDLGGLGIAHKAYRLSLEGKEAPVIDGYTGDQRFFLGWAQVWRAKSRDEEAKLRLTTDPHSPAKFRANGAAVNVNAFYEAFDVQEGDSMYLSPEDRVKIW